MSPVFIEERDYRIKPGKAGLFVSTYEQYGLGLQKKNTWASSWAIS